jgi:signal transduction histidine kinase/DNA-binding response OmpR family regulator/CHASE3 domain sensor protein
MLRNISIGLRLWTSFGLLLLITLAIGVITLSSLNRLSALTSDIYSHPLAVGNAVRDVKINIGKIRVEMVTIGLLNDESPDYLATLEQSLNEIDDLEQGIYLSFSLIKERFLGSQQLVDATLELIRNWKPLRDEEIKLAKSFKQSELIATIKGRGARLVERINENMHELKLASNKHADNFLEESDIQRNETTTFLVSLLGLIFLSGSYVAYHITRGITMPLQLIQTTAEAIAGGELDTDVGRTGNDEIGQLAYSITHMQASLRETYQQYNDAYWHKDTLAKLNKLIFGNPSMEKLSSDIITGICELLDAKLGTLYLLNSKTNPATLNYSSGFGYSPDSSLQQCFKIGEGLIGQAALEKQPILLNAPPQDYIKVRSSLGDSTPGQLAIFPCFHESALVAVLEIGLFRPLSDLELAFLEEALNSVGIAIQAAANRETLNATLATAQRLTEEAQAQQEEMEALNEELAEQNKLLNQEKEKVEQTQQELQTQAECLAQTSRYKSEFLANMSHELRTPLNSLLLLSRGLADNKDSNLDEDQVQSARIIYQCGNDLLNLINEILDLSKIEAGQMELSIESTPLEETAEAISYEFRHLADEKGLSLEVTLDETAPKSINTDRRRLEQILKNLLSNAIKFTDSGGIKVKFSASQDHAAHALAISVTDSGIGIAPNQQGHIFEAFKQADGSTSRKFGGTGLGLSISRELANLLGGEISLKSEPGKGSVFTLLLPAQAPGIRLDDELSPQAQINIHSPTAPSKKMDIVDDRNKIESGDRVLLIVEDDLAFLEILKQESHKHNFKCIASPNGGDVQQLAVQYQPDAIILDLILPDMNGWQVLGQLKRNIKTRHIPVHIASVMDPDNNALRNGAIGYLQKPTSKEDLEKALSRLEQIVAQKTRNLLIIEDDADSRRAIIQLIGNDELEIDEAKTASAALELIKTKHYDCVILDLGLPDMDGNDLLEKIAADSSIEIPPIVIYTGRELSRKEELKLRSHSDSIIIKSAYSEDRLLDETSLFLHRVVAELPKSKRDQIERIHESDERLKDKKILVVDDDMRTLFAVTKLLSEHGMEAIKADGGERALDLFTSTADVDLILMDIMMPGLDGYQTIQRIRELKNGKSVPIIALTAKAMPEDRQACLDAGANDYMSKPIDPTGLISLLRVWLYR